MGLSPAALLVDSAGHIVVVTEDGGVYRLGTITKVLNSSGSQIDPATESTLAARATSAAQTDGSQKSQVVDGTGDVLEIDASGRAAVQDSPNTDVALSTRATEATLSAIKDVDGIKKITDPLPAGTNNIGDVDVVSSALPTGAATEATLATRATAAAQTDGTQKSQVVDSTGDSLEIDASGRAAIQNQPNMDVALSTRATEATLLAADGRLTTIDAVLDSIKDTEGIKKITDQLPAGTNEIGAVAQGTKAAAAAAWPQYIVDDTGNKVGVVLDGSIYRLQSDAKVAKGASALCHLEGLDVSSGIVRLKSTLYSQDGDPIAFGSVAPNPANIKNAHTLNGGSDDLLVNGSVTPVAFTYNADATYDVSILEVKFVLVSNSVTFGSDYFGSKSGPLPNGVLVEITSNGTTGTVDVLQVNEDFVFFASPGGFDWVVSSKDMVFANWLVGGAMKLYAGTGDNIKVTIRDDLSSAGVFFKCFVKGNLLD